MSDLSKNKDYSLFEHHINYFLQFLSESRKENLLTSVENRTHYITVAVEDVYHEHNASAIVRTCDCFGIQEMHIFDQSLDGKVARGMAKGADKWVDVRRWETPTTETMLEKIRIWKAEGRKIVATSPHRKLNNYTPKTLPLEAPICILFGKERQGLTDALIEESDYSLTVPMYGFTESFNVSVSAALILQTLVERLRDEEIDWRFDELQTLKMKLRFVLKAVAHREKLWEDYQKKFPQLNIPKYKEILLTTNYLHKENI